MAISKIEEILRVERARVNMTVEEMCDSVKIPRQTYYNMKSTGFKSLRASDLITLADLFGVTTDYLRGRTQ